MDKRMEKKGYKLKMEQDKAINDARNVAKNANRELSEKEYGEYITDFGRQMEAKGYRKKGAFARFLDKLKLRLCFGNRRKMWEVSRIMYIRELMYRVEKIKTVPTLRKQLEARQDKMVEKVERLRCVLDEIEKNKQGIKELEKQISLIERNAN